MVKKAAPTPAIRIEPPPEASIIIKSGRERKPGEGWSLFRRRKAPR